MTWANQTSPYNPRRGSEGSAGQTCLTFLKRIDRALLELVQWGRPQAQWREMAVVLLVTSVAAAATFSEYYLHRRVIGLLLWIVAVYMWRDTLTRWRASHL